MFPHDFLTLQATWRLGGRQIRSERRRSNRRASIAWTRVHAIARSNTCLKYILSELIAGHIFRHVDASWASDLRRAEDHAISIGRPRDRAIEALQSTWLHRSNGHIAGAYDSDLTARKIPIREDRWSVGFRSNGVCSVWKNSTIAARSNRDRGAIEPQSRRVRRGIVAGRTDGDRRRVSTTIDARSRPDRGGNRGENRGKSEAKLKLKSSRFVVDLKPRPMPKESPPRCLKTAPTNASIGHDLRANFSFKNSCSSSLFFNFWSTREEIKRVSRKVLSSRDPLLPRV